LHLRSRTPLVSRDLVAPNGRSSAHIANILNYATPGLTNKKRLGTPLIDMNKLDMIESRILEICSILSELQTQLTEQKKNEKETQKNESGR